MNQPQFLLRTAGEGVDRPGRGQTLAASHFFRKLLEKNVVKF
jgi:hypothetical protein